MVGSEQQRHIIEYYLSLAIILPRSFYYCVILKDKKKERKGKIYIHFKLSMLK